jgi:hypothetical protein
VSALAFWKAVVEDRSNFLERVLALLEEHRIRFCVIGGVAVNAYSEPLITQDLDIVVAAGDLERALGLLRDQFRVREFANSFNVYDPGSKLQVQLQRDPTMADFVDRAMEREVLDLRLPVAAPEDLVRAKLAAATEPTRRPSKRGKDLLDVARLVSAFPRLLRAVPPELRPRVMEMLDEEPSE